MPIQRRTIPKIPPAFAARYLFTPQPVRIAGDVEGASVSQFDGSAPIDISLTLPNVNSNIGTFGDSTHVGQFTVNAKGQVTAAASIAISFPADTGITQLTGDVTAGPGSGSQVATLANSGATAGTYGDGTHVAQITVDAKGRVTSISNVAITGGGGSGTVTSVGLTMPAVFSVGGTPVTTSGTLAVTLQTQSANLVWAGPTTGSAATPTFRALVAADLPVATTSGFGAVKPDGSTITISAGVISATGGGGGQHKYELFGALPLAASFTGVSTSKTSLTDGSVSLFVSWTGSGANTFELWKKSAPSTPYDIYLRLMTDMRDTNDQVGLIVRNSTTGRFIVLSQNYQNFISWQRWTNPTTFSAAIFTANNHGVEVPRWLRITNNGTTLSASLSHDGDKWFTFATTEALATFISSADEYGVGIVPFASGGAWIGSFSTTVPT